MGKGDAMARFLNYEDRLEIERGLKEHMSFTEIGKKLGCLEVAAKDINITPGLLKK